MINNIVVDISHTSYVVGTSHLRCQNIPVEHVLTKQSFQIQTKLKQNFKKSDKYKTGVISKTAVFFFFDYREKDEER